MAFQANQEWILVEKVTFLSTPGANFGDLHAEISQFQSRKLYLNSVKLILYSSNQNYMTIQFISGHTVSSGYWEKK